MSDKKNDVDTNFEESLAEMANKKPRNHAKDKIYKRLINDVQSNDDDNNETEYVKPLESAEKLFAYEPLSVNELELFTNQDSDQAGQIEAVETTTTTNAVFDFSDQETVMSEASLKKEPQATDKLLEVDHLANDISNSRSDDYSHEKKAIQPLIKEKAASRVELANSKKPLIIGMIFGSLLIALIVMILIFTGVLSTSTQSTTPDNADANVSSDVSTTITPDSTPVATPAQATAIDADIVEKPIVVAPQQDSQDSLANESQGEGATTTTNEAATPKALPTEPALTYEDFREESQSTLYRETDN
ncbi:hypothetical protein [Psychrobacter immobilis]|uniref:hypothetical protein n=1 Tax=Psychrobacter immobilis TaxID=498 RepID=UPI00191B3DF5|nr:hypothetical protein [Psychrobacter immobilis]